MSPVLYIMSGLPASGKSSLARQLASASAAFTALRAALPEDALACAVHPDGSAIRVSRPDDSAAPADSVAAPSAPKVQKLNSKMT